MKNENIILEDNHCITTYPDAIAFDVFCPDVPKIFKEEAITMLNKMTNVYRDHQIKIMADAELIVSHNGHLNDCKYAIVSYTCTEEAGIQSERSEILPGTNDYEELKKYVLQLICHRLFI